MRIMNPREKQTNKSVVFFFLKHYPQIVSPSPGIRNTKERLVSFLTRLMTNTKRASPVVNMSWIIPIQWTPFQVFSHVLHLIRCFGPFSLAPCPSLKWNRSWTKILTSLCSHGTNVPQVRLVTTTEETTCSENIFFFETDLSPQCPHINDLVHSLDLFSLDSNDITLFLCRHTLACEQKT